MPKTNLKQIVKKFDLNLIGIYVILGVLYYSLNLELNTLFGIVFGSLIAFIFFIQLPEFKDNFKEALLVVVSVITAYVFFGNITFLSGITLGTAFTSFYLHLSQKYKIDITNTFLFNGTIIISVVLLSAIEKFRGFNKLSEMDIKLMVPLIIASVLAYHFLILIVKSVNKIKQDTKDIKLLIATIIILGNIFFLISFATFKEIGNYLILGPLLGALAVFSAEILKLNFKIDILNILIFVFLISYPYQIAGVLGISLAFLVSILLLKFLVKKDYQKNIIVYQLFFILYIYASSEFRENEGLIPKFNLVNGMQIVYLFVATTIIIKFNFILEKFNNLLVANELTNLFNFAVTLLSIIFIQVGLKYFGWDLIIGTIITGTIILSLINGFKQQNTLESIEKTEDNFSLLNTNSVMFLLNLLGAILLNVSVKI